MKRSIVAALTLVAALVLPGMASAQTETAYARGNINMRAGPDIDYPVIATIGSGSVVNVYGCIRGYDWCDVRVRNYRGWVYARRLEFAYRGERVLIPEYGSAFGAPIIRFDFGYWDRYYQDRPFYSERGRWERDWGNGGHYSRYEGNRDGERGPNGPPPRPGCFFERDYWRCP